MSWKIFTIVAAMGCAGLMASPASAAPAGFGVLKSAAAADTSAMNVHWRRHRHCHRRHGRRHCHGRRHYRSYGWPGVSLYFGTRHRHHRHHRRHH